MTNFSRQHPSAQYQKHIDLYKKMHTEGCPECGKEPIYRGFSLKEHFGKIDNLIKKTDSHTLLDYGSGKGILYKPQYAIHRAWGIEEVYCYDPAVEDYATLPDKKFDAVICIDVMEHIPEEDVDWVLDEIFSFAKKFIFLSISCKKAGKTLADGTNAHCTVRPPTWWQEKMRKHGQHYPHIIWHICCAVNQNGKQGYRNSNNLKYFL